MRKNDYREILSEKFKTASQLQTGPLSEEDEEYLRILAEARAVHAVKKAEREAAQRAAKEALQKRMTTSLAAVVLLAALLTGSYILGLNTDIRASADPDDEIKVVQQGDNIIIGPGVSENDENVGVVTYTYTNEEQLPGTIKKDIHIVRMENVLLQKVKVVVSDNNMSIDAYYELDGKEFRVHEEVFSSDVEPFTVLNERARVWENSGKLIIYFDDSGHSDVYSFLLEKSVMSLFVPTDFLQKEIEAIIYSLETD